MSRQAHLSKDDLSEAKAALLKEYPAFDFSTLEIVS
jgi:hypothetical protein